MTPFITMLLASWLAGVAAFVGGLVAWWERTSETREKAEWIHGVVAFGGGILVAAVAFALAPEGLKELPPWGLATMFCLGGLGFCWLDIQMSHRGGSKAQFVAMLADFVPEAIAMGAVFVGNQRLGVLLAAFIGAQNLPEGFNSFREIVGPRFSARKTLTALLAISVLGPLAAAAGHLTLRDRPQLTAAIMSFAAGGILYLIFQDIAPQAKLKRHWTPPLGAVLGFTVGMVGKQVLG